MLPGVALVEIDVARLDGQHAAVGHGVAGVDDQVHQHLLELRRVEADAAEIARGDDAQLDVLADDAPQQVLHLHDQRVEIDDARLGDLPAREAEELPGQRRAALGGVADAAEVLVRRVVAFELGAGHLDVAEDGRQQVVEVVGDAAGEAADALHLLGLQELRFEPLALGDVLHHAEHADRLAAIVGVGLPLRGHPPRLVVRRVRVGDGVVADHPELDVERQALGDGVPHRVVEAGAVLGMDQLEEDLEAQRLAALHHVEDAGGVAGPAHGVVLQVQVPGADLAAVERHAEALLAVAQGLLGLLARRDVEHRADHPARAAVRAAHDVAAGVDVGEGAVAAAEPVFVRPQLLAQAIVERAPDPRLIVGVDGLPPPLDPRRVGVDRVPELGAQAVVPPHRVGGEIPVPDRFVRGAPEERQPLVALAHDLAQLAAQAGHFLLVILDDAAKTVLLGEGSFTCQGSRGPPGGGRGAFGHSGAEMAQPEAAFDYGGCADRPASTIGPCSCGGPRLCRPAVRTTLRLPCGGAASRTAAAALRVAAAGQVARARRRRCSQGSRFPGRRAPFERPTWPKPN